MNTSNTSANTTSDPIEPYIQHKILVLSEDTPVRVAARAMNEKHVGSVLVGSADGMIGGILTDRDLATQVMGFGLSLDTPLSEIMCRDVISVEEDATIDAVVKLMEAHAIRRMVISRKPLHPNSKNSSGGKRFFGIISLDDLIVAGKVSVEQIRSIVKAQTVNHHVRISNRQRSESHTETTLGRFNNIMALHMNVDKERAETMNLHILKDLIQILSYTTAAHFIIQLPKLLQEDLFDLPAGPNRQINAAALIHSLSNRYQLASDQSRKVVRGFWAGLTEFLKSENPVRLLEHLPADVSELLLGRTFTAGTLPRTNETRRHEATL